MNPLQKITAMMNTMPASVPITAASRNGPPRRRDLFQRSSDCEGGAVAVASLGWSGVASVITTTVTRLTLGFAENWRPLPRSRRHTRVQRWLFVWCAQRRGAAGRPDGNTLPPACRGRTPLPRRTTLRCSSSAAARRTRRAARRRARCRASAPGCRGPESRHVLEAVPVGEQHPRVEPLVTSGDKKLPLAVIDPQRRVVEESRSADGALARPPRIRALPAPGVLEMWTLVARRMASTSRSPPGFSVRSRSWSAVLPSNPRESALS
jgi:hypothetical protein